MQRVVHWLGIDDRHRLDEATIGLGDGELSAAGTSRTLHYLLRWSLQTGPEWVEVPSLRVIRSEQIYQLRRIEPGGASIVRCVGLHRSFVADLSVDAAARCRTRQVGADLHGPQRITRAGSSMTVPRHTLPTTTRVWPPAAVRIDQPRWWPRCSGA